MNKYRILYNKKLNKFKVQYKSEHLAKWNDIKETKALTPFGGFLDQIVYFNTKQEAIDYIEENTWEEVG